jgi:transposase InsO family protein
MNNSSRRSRLLWIGSACWSTLCGRWTRDSFWIYGRSCRTAIPYNAAERVADSVQRQFVADRPNQVWVADIAYVAPEAGVESSVGSSGDSYDNALAETINGLYKTEINHKRGPRRTVDEVEYATLEWVDWFNHPGHWSLLATFPRRSWIWRIIANWMSRPWRHDSRKRVSGIPGAIQVRRVAYHKSA